MKKNKEIAVPIVYDKSNKALLNIIKKNIDEEFKKHKNLKFIYIEENINLDTIDLLCDFYSPCVMIIPQDCEFMLPVLETQSVFCFVDEELLQYIAKKQYSPIKKAIQELIVLIREGTNDI